MLCCLYGFLLPVSLYVYNRKIFYQFWYYNGINIGFQIFFNYLLPFKIFIDYKRIHIGVKSCRYFFSNVCVVICHWCFGGPSWVLIPTICGQWIFLNRASTDLVITNFFVRHPKIDHSKPCWNAWIKYSWVRLVSITEQIQRSERVLKMIQSRFNFGLTSKVPTLSVLNL